MLCINDQELSFICVVNLQIRNRYQLGIWLCVTSPFGSDAVGDVSGWKAERELVSESRFDSFKILIDWNVFSTIGFCRERF